jgi:hypothetical protein
MALLGIGLFVFYLKWPHPNFYGGRHSVVDSSMSQWAIVIGGIYTAVFGLGSVVHYGQQKFKRTWPRGRRWRLSIFGLLLGAYLILAAFAVSGYIGERTSNLDFPPNVKTPCHYLANQHEYSDWTACDLVAKWPDGTTTTVKAVPARSTDTPTDLTVVRPGFDPWPFAGNEHGFQLQDLVSLLAVGVPIALQAIFSILVLIIGGGGQRRRARDAALPPGQLPV